MEDNNISSSSGSSVDNINNSSNNTSDSSSSSSASTADETETETETETAIEQRRQKLSKHNLNLTLDNFDSDEIPDDYPYVLTSPRSLAACKHFGVRVSNSTFYGVPWRDSSVGRASFKDPGSRCNSNDEGSSPRPRHRR